MSIIQIGLEIIGGVVVLAVVHAACETIAYAISLEIDKAKKHAERLDGGGK